MNGDGAVRWSHLPRSRPERLVVDVQLSALRFPDSPFLIPRLVECFVTLGNAGGLAGADRLPGDSLVELQSRRLDAVSAHFDVAFDGIDSRAISVLVNSLVFSHRLVAPVELLRIGCSLDERDCLVPLDGTVGVLPFETDIEIISDDVQIAATFFEIPGAKAQREIEKNLDAWQNLAASGGFEADIRLASKAFHVAQDDPWWLGREFVLRFESASFDEAALDSLINVFRFVHQHIAAVESVVIG